MQNTEDYIFICASSPKDTLASAGEYSGKIDLLITDIVLPEMNGRELANELNKQYADLKPLFMSGYTANVIAHRGVLDKGINYISKPFSIDAFLEKVNDILYTVDH